MSDLLTLDDVAARFKCSRRTVERWVAAGRLRVVHPSPGLTRVTERELAAYLAHLEGRRVA